MTVRGQFRRGNGSRRAAGSDAGVAMMKNGRTLRPRRLRRGGARGGRKIRGRDAGIFAPGGGTGVEGRKIFRILPSPCSFNGAQYAPPRPRHQHPARPAAGDVSIGFSPMGGRGRMKHQRGLDEAAGDRQFVSMRNSGLGHLICSGRVRPDRTYRSALPEAFAGEFHIWSGSNSRVRKSQASRPVPEP